MTAHEDKQPFKFISNVLAIVLAIVFIPIEIVSKVTRRM